MKKVLIAILAGLGLCNATAQIREGLASWYGQEYAGRPMANGRPFDPDALTCASYDYPLGTVLSVRYTSPRGYSRQVIVTVTDRGPAANHRKNGRIIDLSHTAFRVLESPKKGLIKVRVEVLP